MFLQSHIRVNMLEYIETCFLKKEINDMVFFSLSKNKAKQNKRKNLTL